MATASPVARYVRPFARGEVPLSVFSKSFDALGDPVAIVDTEAHILYANKMMEVTTGYNWEEMRGKNPQQLWGGKMPKEFYERFWHTIRVEKKPFIGEVQCQRKDGVYYWKELHVTPIVRKNGDVRLLVVIEPSTDVRHEELRRREELAAIMGHQLKNPIATDRLLLEFLLNDDALSDDEKESVTALYQDNLEITKLINELLAYAGVKVEHANPETFDLAAEVAHSIDAIRKNHPSITFEFTPSGRFPLSAPKTLAAQVVRNIITNAAEYSDSLHGSVQLQLIRAPRSYLLSCSDSGIGIPKKEQRGIFTRAFRATNAKHHKKGGTGLGLYISKMIADGLGWEISFRSELRRGTTFYVKIPRDSLQQNVSSVS